MQVMPRNFRNYLPKAQRNIPKDYKFYIINNKQASKSLSYECVKYKILKEQFC